VRYLTGDLASWAEGPCACGWTGQRIARIHGRAQEVIELPSGAVVSAAALNLHTGALDGIRQLQYAQTSRDRLVLRVVPADGWAPEREQALVQAVEPRVPGMKVSVETVPSLTPGPSGKVPYAVSEL
jgi:phenylacetate-CoA ligase